jgi:hypothetical protein
LLKRAERPAKADGATVERLLAIALAETVSALDTVDLIQDRTSRAGIDCSRAMLPKVPDVPAGPGDELPAE